MIPETASTFASRRKQLVDILHMCANEGHWPARRIVEWMQGEWNFDDDSQRQFGYSLALNMAGTGVSYLKTKQDNESDFTNPARRSTTSWGKWLALLKRRCPSHYYLQEAFVNDATIRQLAEYLGEMMAERTYILAILTTPDEISAIYSEQYFGSCMFPDQGYGVANYAGWYGEPGVCEMVTLRDETKGTLRARALLWHGTNLDTNEPVTLLDRIYPGGAVSPHIRYLKEYADTQGWLVKDSQSREGQWEGTYKVTMPRADGYPYLDGFSFVTEIRDGRLVLTNDVDGEYSGLIGDLRETSGHPRLRVCGKCLTNARDATYASPSGHIENICQPCADREGYVSVTLVGQDDVLTEPANAVEFGGRLYHATSIWDTLDGPYPRDQTVRLADGRRVPHEWAQDGRVVRHRSDWVLPSEVPAAIIPAFRDGDVAIYNNPSRGSRNGSRATIATYDDRDRTYLVTFEDGQQNWVEADRLTPIAPENLAVDDLVILARRVQGDDCWYEESMRELIGRTFRVASMAETIAAGGGTISMDYITLQPEAGGDSWTVPTTAVRRASAPRTNTESLDWFSSAISFSPVATDIAPTPPRPPVLSQAEIISSVQEAQAELLSDTIPNDRTTIESIGMVLNNAIARSAVTRNNIVANIAVNDNNSRVIQAAREARQTRQTRLASMFIDGGEPEMESITIDEDAGLLAFSEATTFQEEFMTGILASMTIPSTTEENTHD
jgi:hypothetical protein